MIAYGISNCCGLLGFRGNMAEADTTRQSEREKLMFLTVSCYAQGEIFIV